MSFRGYIGARRMLASLTVAAALPMALLGAIESQYVAAGSVSALVYGFGLYGLVGTVFGLLFAVLFGGQARSGREGLERASGRVAAIPIVVMILAAGGFLVYRDAMGESFSGGGFLGWLAMLLVPLAAAGGGWLARAVGRGVAVRPVVACALVVPLAVMGVVLGGTIEQLPLSGVNVEGSQGATEDKPHVVLVVVDALRADAVGVFGGPRDATPNMDAFSRDAVVFRNAWAPATWTRPAVASILTGRYPVTHRTAHKSDRLPEGLPTLAGLLQKSGYVTVASVTNVNLAPVFGLGRGFDVWAYFPPKPFLGAPNSARRLFLVEVYRLFRLRFLPGQRSVARYYAEGERVLERAVDLMAAPAKARIPFFAYLHFMEPHDPYFAHPLDGRAVARVENPNPPVEVAPDYLELYRQEVGAWDDLFGELLEQLKKLGIYDRALLIVTADHGEEFADHGAFWHGTSLYEELVRVPLIVRFPGGAGGGMVQDTLVSLVDIVPTALSLAGIKPPAGLAGVPLTFEPLPEGRVLHAEEDHQGFVLRSVRSGPWKLIQSNPDNPRGFPELQLFNLAVDPLERTNLIDKEPDQLDRLTKLLEAGPRQGAAPAVRPEGVEIDSATEEQLRSLGYTE